MSEDARLVMRKLEEAIERNEPSKIKEATDMLFDLAERGELADDIMITPLQRKIVDRLVDKTSDYSLMGLLHVVGVDVSKFPEAWTVRRIVEDLLKGVI